jgi:heat shock protein
MAFVPAFFFFLRVVTYSDAMCSCYINSHPLNEGEESRKVMFVDCGHSSFTVTVADFRPDGPHILSSSCDTSLGVRFMHQKVFAEFQNQAKEKHGMEVSVPSKGSLRLLGGCEKITKLLSTVTPTNVTVENLGMDMDVNFKLSRGEFETLCADQVKALKDALAKALEESGVPAGSLASVEVVGGGTRIPFLKEAVSVVAGVDEKSLGYKIDSNAGIAFGAAYLVKCRHAAIPQCTPSARHAAIPPCPMPTVRRPYPNMTL